MARHEDLTFHVHRPRPAPAPSLRVRGSQNRQAAVHARTKRNWGGVLIALLVFVALPVIFYWLLRA